MEKVTFDQLPEMVYLILQKLERIEELIANDEKIELRPGKEMLTTKEAAEFMGISMSKLYKMSFNRDIPIYKPTGGRIYFKKADINNYLQQNRVMSNAEIEQKAVEHLSYLNNKTSKRSANRLNRM